jgi:hypothetical protein
MRQAAYGGIIASSSRTVYAIRKIVVGGFYEWNERRRMQRMKRRRDSGACRGPWKNCAEMDPEQMESMLRNRRARCMQTSRQATAMTPERRRVRASAS